MKFLGHKILLDIQTIFSTMASVYLLRYCADTTQVLHTTLPMSSSESAYGPLNEVQGSSSSSSLFIGINAAATPVSRRTAFGYFVRLGEDWVTEIDENVPIKEMHKQVL